MFNNGNQGLGRGNRRWFCRCGCGNERLSSNRNRGDKGNDKINKRGLIFIYTEPKECKEFKISLGGANSEKLNVPLYGNYSKQEMIFILNKRYNIMFEGGDLFQENTGMLQEMRITEQLWWTRKKDRN